MAKESKYSISDLRRDFPDDSACLDLVFETLHSRDCSCGGTYKRISGRRQYQCGRCRFQIAPASTTIFHKSDTPLSLWFHAIFIFANAKSGISAKEMERQLGVTYKCAWRILSLIRKALTQDGGKLKGDVEIDTGYLGGKGNAGRNNERLSDVMAKKSVVTVAVERGGRIRAEVLPDATSKTMTDFINRNVEEGIDTNILTDNSKVYWKSDRRFVRFSVDHGKGEYVRGDVHINAVEAFFAHLKRSISGTYKVISRQHLQAYLDAFVFHYNNRHNDRERFAVLLGTLLRA